jgi:hypothetical protein
MKGRTTAAKAAAEAPAEDGGQPPQGLLF